VTYYHASVTPIGDLKPKPLYVTPNKDAALEYLCGSSGVLYRVEVSGRLADEDDIRDVAEELYPESPYTNAWELLEEHPNIIPALVSQGYSGAEYNDMTPDNATEHLTIIIFNAAKSARLFPEENVFPNNLLDIV